jgi:predicted naringenin-chalcone synthase
VLGIGTANPTNCVPQDEYADWYFRVTKSEHLTKLKAKMKKICETLDASLQFQNLFQRSQFSSSGRIHIGYNSAIKKRYFHHTADTFRDHPELADRALPSLDARLAILAPAVPELAAAAAAKAIAAWGRPASDVTHLILATYSGAHMPGADLRLASLLGLRRSTQRTMLYLGGCAAGSAALRIARDVAENNPSARVLVVCAELSLVLFRAPRVDDPGTLVMQSLFGDGAGAVIVGAGSVERPMFEIMSATQTVIPGSEDAAAGHLSEDGLRFCPSQRMPNLVRQHVEECLLDAVSPLGLGGGGWNDLFWAVHPGGPAILDGVQAGLALAPRKLAASRRVLSEYGNMSGASIIFVLDELWRRHREELDGRLGVMLGLGPGISVESLVLRSTICMEKK